jgi:hypothetical protein
MISGTYPALGWHGSEATVEPVAGASPAGLGLLAAVALVSLLCIPHLWRWHAAPALEKLGLTIVVLVPVIGPLLYGSVFTRIIRVECPAALPQARLLRGVTILPFKYPRSRGS